MKKIKYFLLFIVFLYLLAGMNNIASGIKSTQIIEPVIQMEVGSNYDVSGNVYVKDGDSVTFDTDLDTSQAGEYTVIVHVDPVIGADFDLHYKIVIKEPCEPVWVIDQPEVPESGHYETIHHPAKTRIETKGKEVPVWQIYIDADTYTFPYEKYTEEEIMEIMDELILDNGYNWEDGDYDLTTEYVITETKETVIEEAWDEQVYVVDTPYQAEKGHWDNSGC